MPGLMGFVLVLSSAQEGRLRGVADAVGSIVKGISSLCPTSVLLWRLKKLKIRLGEAKRSQYCITGPDRSSTLRSGRAASRCSNFSSFQCRAS